MAAWKRTAIVAVVTVAYGVVFEIVIRAEAARIEKEREEDGRADTADAIASIPIVGGFLGGLFGAAEVVTNEKSKEDFVEMMGLRAAQIVGVGIGAVVTLWFAWRDLIRGPSPFEIAQRSVAAGAPVAATTAGAAAGTPAAPLAMPVAAIAVPAAAGGATGGLEAAKIGETAVLPAPGAPGGFAPPGMAEGGSVLVGEKGPEVVTVTPLGDDLPVPVATSREARFVP
jgi:HAMP domain-containing protein